MIRAIIACVCIGLGVLLDCVAVLGVYRFRYVLNQMHAAAIVDTGGTLLIFIGAILLYGFSPAALKILLILVVQWVTSPVCSNRLARMEVLTNEKLENHLEVE